jgi:hypothetical protein
MGFDSVFNGDPTTPNVTASGNATIGIDVSTGNLYYKDAATAGWVPTASEGTGLPRLSLKAFDVTVSSAQLLSLSSDPVLLVPGIPGHVFLPVLSVLKYKFVTTPYTLSPTFAIQLGTGAFESTFGAIGLNDLAGLIDQSVDTIFAGAEQALSVTATAVASAVGLGLYLVVASPPDVTVGDGTLNIVGQYFDYKP